VFLCEDEEYPVLNLSASGFLFASPNGAVWDPGSEVHGQLVLHGEPVLDSKVRVARVEAAAKGCRVGVDAQQPLELDGMLALDAERTFASLLGRGPDQYRAAIPDDYLAAVRAIQDFLLYYKPLIDGEEGRLSKLPDSSTLLRKLAERSFDAMKDRWRELEIAASRTGWDLKADPAAHHAAKRYTELTITPLLLGCPVVNRSWNKPLGYAGDYHVMEYYYRDDFEGETIFDQVMHRLLLQNPMARGVVSRAKFMVTLLDEEHSRRSNGEPGEFAVANLGCGPGREVELWAETTTNRGAVKWTLIDQEEQALALAYQIGHQAVRATEREAQLNLLHLSFAKLLRSPEAFNFRPQHYIFSSGLFDYLRQDRAQVLIRALYDRLLPGGLLAIGNAIGPNTNLWSPEFVGDWPILYRSRNEMEGLAALLPGSAQVEIVVEPGEAYYFLLVRKE
jgi:SAM-dependent methyltransferase